LPAAGSLPGGSSKAKGEALMSVLFEELFRQIVPDPKELAAKMSGDKSGLVQSINAAKGCWDTVVKR
jgi:hypothetical protein